MTTLYVIREKTTGLWCTSSKRGDFNKEFGSDVALFRSVKNAQAGARSMMAGGGFAAGFWTPDGYVKVESPVFLVVPCTLTPA